MGITRELADFSGKANTAKTIFDDGVIAHNEVSGFDTQVTVVAQPLATNAKNEAESTATALAIALGG